MEHKKENIHSVIEVIITKHIKIFLVEFVNLKILIDSIAIPLSFNSISIIIETEVVQFYTKTEM